RVAASPVQTAFCHLYWELVLESPSDPPSSARVLGEPPPKAFLFRVWPRCPTYRAAWTQRQNILRPGSNCHSIQREDCSIREARHEHRFRPLQLPKAIAIRSLDRPL